MVDVCWLLDPKICPSHGPGRSCTSLGDCYYKTDEARRLLKPLHEKKAEQK